MVHRYRITGGFAEDDVKNGRVAPRSETFNDLRVFKSLLFIKNNQEYKNLVVYQEAEEVIKNYL